MRLDSPEAIAKVKARLLRIPRCSDPKWQRLERFAEEMRKRPTAAEKALWRELRDCKPYWSFQSVQYPFIVDFYCHERRLVIEVDGGYHFSATQREMDAARTAYLKREYGLKVIRLTNREVYREQFMLLWDMGILPEPKVWLPDLYGDPKARERLQQQALEDAARMKGLRTDTRTARQIARDNVKAMNERAMAYVNPFRKTQETQTQPLQRKPLRRRLTAKASNA